MSRRENHQGTNHHDILKYKAIKCPRTLILRKCALASAVALGAILPSVSQAALELDEVVVTARKQAEGLQDVPISVAVMGGEKIDKMGVTGLEEISAFMPTVRINENASQQSVYIRGIGSGANQGFEQSVGTFIDGVYFGRGRSARSPFLDIERVEVLKGPQSILFGKNTIAGALNITTRKPTDEFEASFGGSYFFDDYESYSLTGAVSGPLSDTFAARLVVKVADSDGYLENDFTGKDEPRKEEQVARLTTVWTPTEQTEVTFKGEVSTYDVDGRHHQIVEAGNFLPFYQAVDPNFEDNFDYTKSSGGKATGAKSIFNEEFDYTDSYNAMVQFDHELNDSTTLTAITAITGYEFENSIDPDFSPLTYMVATNEQEHQQWSQELRIQGDISDNITYITGVYYGVEDLEIVNNTHLDLVGARDDLGFPGPPWQGSGITSFQQDTDTLALFAQGMWHLSDSVRLNVGLRYTKDEKDMDKSLFRTTTYTDFPDPTATSAWLPHVPHSESHSRTDEDINPSVTVEYDISGDVMLYATYAEGFKSGGFDTAKRTPSATLDDAGFDPEEVQSVDLGAKMDFGDAKVNVALFRSEFNDLQVSAWDGTRFVVDNAAQAVTQGLEVDGEWLLSENFKLGFALALLDSEFDSFPGAGCSAPQQVAYAAATGMSPNSCLQDLSGKPLQFAPEWSGNLNLTYFYPLSDNLELTANMDINFTDEYHTALDNDPNALQDSFSKVNLRLELADVEGSWSVALIGKNITDEKTTTWVNDTPFARGSYFGFIDQPSTLGVQFHLAY